MNGPVSALAVHHTKKQQHAIWTLDFIFLPTLVLNVMVTFSFWGRLSRGGFSTDVS
jgi:hypothetical protein